MVRRIYASSIAAIALATAAIGVRAESIGKVVHEFAVTPAEWVEARDSGLDVLGKENTLSVVSVTATNGKPIAKWPSPALDEVVVLDEARVVIGLSRSFDEPFNLVIWDSRGKVLLAAAVTCEELSAISPNACSIHSSEKYEWYDTNRPIESAVKLNSSTGSLSLRLRGGARLVVKVSERRSLESSRTKSLVTKALQRLGSCNSSSAQVSTGGPLQAYAWCQRGNSREGLFVVTTMDGNSSPFVKIEGSFSADKKNGRWRSYEALAAGHYLSSVNYFRDGLADGLEVRFWPDGKPITIGSYTRGEPDGTHVTLDNAGMIVEIAVFRDGELVDCQDSSAFNEH